MIGPTIGLCVTVRDRPEELRRLLLHLKPCVERIVVTVEPGGDEARLIALDLADVVIDGKQVGYMEEGYPAQFEAAGTDYCLLMDTDETLCHPERLRGLAEKDNDLYYFPRKNRIDRWLSKSSGQHDLQMRMLKPGKAIWKRAMHMYPEHAKDAKIYHAFECWINHYRTLEVIRQRTASYQTRALENDERPEVMAMQAGYLEAVEREAKRNTELDGRISILLSYNGVVGIGDTLMTLSAVREVRRQYPEATITYRTQQADTLGKGRKVDDWRWECLHPAIDYIDTVPPGGYGDDEAAYGADFDLVFNWECSLTGPPGHRENGYELEAQWIGFEPADGNYQADWSFARDELKFGKTWLRQHCKTPRCIGLVLAASCLHRTWPLMEDWVNAVLEEFPDVSIMTFGSGHTHLLEVRSQFQQYGFRGELANPGDTATMEHVWVTPHWYDPERFICCSCIDQKQVHGVPAWRAAMGLSVREMAAVFPYLDLVVTPDSGPMHIAAALCVPTVAYFSLVPSELRVKHFSNCTVLDAEYPCSPCFIHGQIKCPKTTEEGAPCLLTITVDKMMEAVRQRLGVRELAMEAA